MIHLSFLQKNMPSTCPNQPVINLSLYKTPKTATTFNPNQII